MDLGLSGHVVLVTGGVRGVGAGISGVLTELGATVIACARRPGEDGAAHPYAEFVSCDIRDAEAVTEMVNQLVERHGRLDSVVNNAGGAPFAMAADASPRYHSKIVELNLLAPLIIAQAANKVMQGQDSGGSIVNVTSLSGRRPSPGTAGYGAAKAGLDSLSGSLAVEWAPKVRVNSVVCGAVRTELADMFYGDEDGIAAVGRTIPMGRLALPSDVGNAVAFLLSPLASYMTGSSMEVHGGGERLAFWDVGTNEIPG